ncbi:hypothetical protein [Limimaricola litoreus]|uniref:Uncharacterized protein n=1 Tax=Limimaricola litoreus TaxID=2955316 RepID=A0A9X2JNX6_9RHOB|nr:hypothetical protein [Limimaricola litoreus]MCP1168928.1 hypothetical protein [Limimaricola litoreus]
MDNEDTEPVNSPVPENSPKLEDDSEKLLRHIKPAWFHNGVPSSQNFEPMPKDRSHLSVERGSQIDAKTAHTRWISWGRESAAVCSVTVGAYQENSAPCFHVPVDDPGEENPEHALVQYPDVRSQASKLAKKIKKKAKVEFIP